MDAIASSESFEDEPNDVVVLGPDESRGKSSSQPHPQNHNKLTLWQGVALLTADCLGVGILALPEDIHVLGWTFGLSFLILQLPINYYAGYILAWTAVQVEQEWELRHQRSTASSLLQGGDDADDANNKTSHNDEDDLEMTTLGSEKRTEDAEESLGEASLSPSEQPRGQARRRRPQSANSSGNGMVVAYTVQPTTTKRTPFGFAAGSSEKQPDVETLDSGVGKVLASGSSGDDDENAGLFRVDDDENGEDQEKKDALPPSSDIPPPPTEDLVGITGAVYDQHRLGDTTAAPSSPPIAQRIVLLIYYLNIFLVLGDYILVMSHAVAAIAGDSMCITTAGLIASTLMFALCQLNTMALLGQYVSMASLAAMLVVLGQCIFASHFQQQPADDVEATTSSPSLLRRFSALASICFAAGSQKLFLNIRYELQDKEQHGAPVLARSLTLFGLAYVLVVLFSGSNPPAFLFDTIPKNTLNRKIGGLLLWGHVAVSYAINSQALCSSLDRLLCGTPVNSSPGRGRWIALTFGLAVSSYIVANGIPFFKDLVALIGAATTVPLTLTIPPVLYQHWQQWTRLANMQMRRRRRGDSASDDSGVPRRSTTRSWECLGSSALLLYSVIFLGVGLAGSLASVKRDWANEGRLPFSCSQS